MPEYSDRSKENLSTCDNLLQIIFNEVIKNYDCSIICGFRNEEDQNKAFHNGYSKLMFPNSKHNIYPSRAVDVVPYPSMWEDDKEFYFLAGSAQSIADKIGIKIRWGGRWKNFRDLPHFEIS